MRMAWQVVEGSKGWGSYFCSSLRSMALSSIDPTLALGFYCANTGDALDRSAAAAGTPRHGPSQASKWPPGVMHLF